MYVVKKIVRLQESLSQKRFSMRSNIAISPKPLRTSTGLHREAPRNGLKLFSQCRALARASSNMLIGGATAPAVKPLAPAVDPKFRHWGGPNKFPQTCGKRFHYTLAGWMTKEVFNFRRNLKKKLFEKRFESNHLVANAASISTQKKTMLSRCFPKQAFWALQLSA